MSHVALGVIIIRPVKWGQGQVSAVDETLIIEMILERQKEGIAKAKEQGKYKGRKPTAQEQADKVLALKSAGVPREKIQE